MKNKIFIHLLAMLQLFGSSVILNQLITNLLNAEAIGLISLGIHFLSIIVSIIGFYAGIALLKNKPSALRLSMLIQAVQIPIIASKPLVYTLVLGFGTPLIIFGSPIHLNFRLGGNFAFFLGNEGTDTVFGLNLWAMFMFAYAYKITKVKLDE